MKSFTLASRCLYAPSSCGEGGARLPASASARPRRGESDRGRKREIVFFLPTTFPTKSTMLRFARPVLRARSIGSTAPSTSAALSTTTKVSSPSSSSPKASPSSVGKDDGEHDSTSALDYKLQHRLRKLPPLPSLEPPEMDASEAVSNILYNTPAPSKQPFKR